MNFAYLTVGVFVAITGMWYLQRRGYYAESRLLYTLSVGVLCFLWPVVMGYLAVVWWQERR